jgi:hypothetical protein
MKRLIPRIDSDLVADILIDAVAIITGILAATLFVYGLTHMGVL